METGQAREKFVYDWRLDHSGVGDVNQGRKLLVNLPGDTMVSCMDGAFDARDVYTMVEEQGARPIIKNRGNAKRGEINARGRAVRWRDAHPSRWQALYDRRPITESVNSSLKRRFGNRLRSRGLWNQRREVALCMLVYNAAMKCRWRTRVRILRREL